MMGAVALLLSAIGMYGLIAHDVSQRRREIGIRMALGAAPARVIGAITLRGLSITALGMIVGAPLAWAMTRAIASLLEESGPDRPAVDRAPRAVARRGGVDRELPARGARGEDSAGARAAERLAPPRRRRDAAATAVALSLHLSRMGTREEHHA